MVHDRVEQGRHARHDRRPRLVDDLERLVEREARHDDELGRSGDAEVHDPRHRKHVEERQDAQDALLSHRELRRPGRHLLHVDVDVGVRQHRALRGARGAAGVLQHGDVVVGAIDRAGPSPCEQDVGADDDPVLDRRGARARQVLDLSSLRQHRLSGRQQLRERGHHDGALERAGRSSASTLSNSSLRSSVTISSVSLSSTWNVQLLDRVERVVVDHRPAGLEHGEVVDDERRAVGEQQAHLRPLLHAELLQPGGGPLGEQPDLGVRVSLRPRKFGARAAAVPRHRLVEQLVEGGREARVPAHLGWIARNQGCDARRRLAMQSLCPV